MIWITIDGPEREYIIAYNTENRLAVRFDDGSDECRQFLDAAMAMYGSDGVRFALGSMAETIRRAYHGH